jgi:hypothetical protein
MSRRTAAVDRTMRYNRKRLRFGCSRPPASPALHFALISICITLTQRAAAVSQEGQTNDINYTALVLIFLLTDFFERQS